MLSDEEKRKEYDQERGYRYSDNMMHQSTKSMLVNGKKVTRVSMFKNNKHIEDVYEDDVLVTRKVNGVLVDLQSVPSCDETTNDKQRIEQLMQNYGEHVFLSTLMCLLFCQWLCLLCCRKTVKFIF